MRIILPTRKGIKGISQDEINSFENMLKSMTCSPVYRTYGNYKYFKYNIDYWRTAVYGICYIIHDSSINEYQLNVLKDFHELIARSEIWDINELNYHSSPISPHQIKSKKGKIVDRIEVIDCTDLIPHKLI